ncbi:MAG: histidine kinase [Ignavibacteriales bacterium]|nr:histidine kinase [Ignavibacteriales bacterium]
MRLRISDVLLVSSLYDLYLFEEDGRLYELIRHEYEGFNLSHPPELTRVSSGDEAIALAKEENRFNLIITTLHIDDMHALDFAKLVKQSGLNIPIVLLAHDNRELKYLLLNHDTTVFDKIFVWQGDFRIIIAIIKYLEDRINVEHDTNIVGIQTIIVVEDNVRYYSSFLPIIYTEILKQSQRLISEGINLTHKFLRMRARPKILLCSTYEEVSKYYQKYKDFMLGVISDIDFPRDGVQDSKAGIEFAKSVKDDQPDLPVLLLSNNIDSQSVARGTGASFILKESPMLLNELRKFMIQYFSFGDFIFRTPEGIEVGRATDLKSLEEQIKAVPEESLRYHGERNHFSNVKETFDPESSVARIGGGSLGGKARGLGFVNTLINDYNVRDRYDGITISVPAAVVIGTDIFDQFLEENNLRDFAFNCTDDREITKKFLEASRFPEEILGELVAFLDIIRTPLAVRSSSLLEDSQYHPFAGVYETYMIPNNHLNPLVRLNDLLNSIKRVYASTFYRSAKDYIKITSYRLEEEKMAVIVQKLVGTAHEDRFYPDISGVAKSYNFYPLPSVKPTDGTVSVALGLGKTVVDGGNTVRFCPKYPSDLIQFYSVKEALNTTQHDFFALQLDASSDFGFETYDMSVKQHGLDVAEKDGPLYYVGSTYSAESDSISEGLSRQGARVVTFAPILKSKLFPLAPILELLLDMGTWGMGTPVEIEFAVCMKPQNGAAKEFGLLQMRPLVVHREPEELEIEKYDQSELLCQSNQVLGNGVIEDIYDIVIVDYQLFERAKSRDVAKEVSMLNARLMSEHIPYLLIGIGRWGTLDPWLGIPVNWEQIAGARVIIEAGMKDMIVTPSQGSHFFQNITSFNVGYFTVNPENQQGYLDWDWLLKQNSKEVMAYTRHIRFNKPLTIKINGHKSNGIILKPEVELE